MTSLGLRHHAAAIAISAVLGTTIPSLVLAQDPGAQDSGTQDTGAQSPSAQAPAAQSPATGEQPSGEAPASDASAAPSGETLPEVKVIQEQPKPEPPKPRVQQAKPKPKKKPAPVVQAPPPAPEPAPVAEPVTAQGAAAYAAPSLSDTVRTSPLAGSELEISKIPGGVGRASAADFARQPTPTPQSVLESQVPGVILSDIQGNEFQTQLDYRGFSSSPVPGVAQGLAVYQNGVRINEAFGDFVNFDALPSNAISDIAIVSGNPVFGLNAVGGAAVITMRDGFNFQGTEIDTRFGSNGRVQGGLATGYRSEDGRWGTFFAIEGINDDGWRDFSPSEIRRLYADVGVKTSEAEFHLNFTHASNFVGVVAAAPVELLDIGRERTFTSPQTTDNDVDMVSLNGSVKASDTLTFSGVGYYRRFRQRHVDGNIAEFDECQEPGNAGFICAEDDGGGEFRLQSGGVDILEDDVGDEPFGSLDNTSQTANGYGFSLQGVDKQKLFNRPNQFVVGLSYDGARVKYNAASIPGSIGPNFVVSNSGLVIDGPIEDDNEFLPRDVTSKNDYLGVYFLNTLDVTDRLAVTVGGRYNYARIDLQDNTGNFDGITSTHDFDRFNPNAGATYKLFPGLTVYGGYSEANRAPTPAELACADPVNPCIIESFLTDDPPLAQVVSKTWEAGLRGESYSASGLQKVSWSIGYFRTLSKDDILALPAEEAGRGFFANSGDTLRQGIEVGLNYASPRLQAYVGYSYIRATFEDTNVLPSPNGPGVGVDVVDCDDPDTLFEPGVTEARCVVARPGDRLPGIPAHRVKAGFSYGITDRWKFGADMVASSSQVFFGDEANIERRLAGWWRVNLNTSYDLNEHVQIYGLINNVFDKRYGVFGNFFDVEEGTEAGEPSGVAFNDPRTILPGAPVAAYAGVKVRF